MGDLATWLSIAVNLGTGGLFLVILYKGLSSGALRTSREFAEKERLQELRLQDKDTYIKRLEELNEKLDKRNDLLARQVGPLLEVSKAHGMLEALPPTISERVVP